MFKQLLFVPLILLLGACSMTQYKVSEAQINQYLKEKVTFDKQLGIPGIMSSQIHLDH
ncbi:MAG: lipoprotein, partial [Aeromonas sp.]